MGKPDASDINFLMLYGRENYELHVINCNRKVWSK